MSIFAVKINNKKQR